MAKEKKSKKKEKEFKEVKFKGQKFNYSGRIYPSDESRQFMYLTLNGCITIQCHLVEGKNGSFISFPSWKNKDGDYKSYIYWDEALEDEMSDLITTIEEALEEMPF